MAVALVSQTTGAGTSNVVFTHNLGATPKLALLFVSREGATTGLSTAQGMACSWGATDGTRQGSVSSGAASSGTDERAAIYNGVTLAIAQNNSNGFSGYASKTLEFSAWTTTTATFVQRDPFGQGETWTVWGLFCTGAEFANVYVGVNQHEVTATNTTFTVAEPPFTPHILLGGVAGMVTGVESGATADGSGAGSQTQFGLGMGITDGTNHFCVHNAGYNGSTTTSATLVRTDRWLQNGVGAEAGTTTQRNALQFVSFDANGFTVRRFEESDTSYQTYFLYVAIRMSNSAYAKVGTFTTQGSTGTFDVTTTGMDPKCVLAFGNGKASAGSATYGNEAKFSFGVAAGAAQMGAGVVADDGSTNASWYSATTMLQNYANATTHAISGEIALSSFGAEKFTLNQSDADTAGILYGYLAFGEAPAGVGGAANGPLIGGRLTRSRLTSGRLVA